MAEEGRNLARLGFARRLWKLSGALAKKGVGCLNVRAKLTLGVSLQAIVNKRGLLRLRRAPSSKAKRIRCGFFA